MFRNPIFCMRIHTKGLRFYRRHKSIGETEKGYLSVTVGLRIFVCENLAFLVSAVQLLLDRLLYVFRATHAEPALQPVKQTPLPREAAGEIADRCWSVQFV